jgi:hypothetical protein
MKNKIIIPIMITALVCMIKKNFSQSSSTIVNKWMVTRAVNLETGQIFNCSGIFEFTDNKILFTQKSNRVQYEFGFRNTPVITTSATTDYEVSFRGMSGSIRLDKSSGNLSVTIDISSGKDRVLPYKFFVQPVY